MDRDCQFGIVEELRADPEAGARRLVAEYGDRLKAAAYKLCNDASTAEDLAFATLERAVARITDCEGDDVLFAWMYVILLNLFRNSVRRRSAKDVIVSEELAKDGSVPAEAAGAPGDGLDSEFLRAAVERLPREMRDAVVMHYFMDLPVAKVAVLVGVPAGTVKSRLHYARLALRELLRRGAASGAVRAFALVLLLAATGLGLLLRGGGDEVRLSDELQLVYSGRSLSRFEGVCAELERNEGRCAAVNLTIGISTEGSLFNDGAVANAIFVCDSDDMSVEGSFELVQIGNDIWGRSTTAGVLRLSLRHPRFTDHDVVNDGSGCFAKLGEVAR